MEATAQSMTRCHHCGGVNPTQSIYCCDACEKLHTVLSIEASQLESHGLLKKYAYLDQPDFKDLYYHQNDDYNYVFYAEGLHCSSCVHLLEKLPDFYDGIEKARVHFGYSTVNIQLKPGSSLARTAALIEELGYHPSPLAAQDDFNERYQKENRTFLKRIAIAGACAGNIMLFVIPVYSGLAGELGKVFNWMSFILYLPILLYSAVPFYQGAWNSLKYRVINVDLPITIAMLSSVGLSAFNLVMGHDEIYFDSTASFMFLILSARYLLKRTQQNYLSPTQMKDFLKDTQYKVLIKENEYTLLPAASIQEQQIVEVSTGQTLPMDCELLSPKAFIDMSLFNGESLPRHYVKGMSLFGGTKLLSEDIQVKITSSQEKSRIGKLLAELDQAALKKTEFLTLTDNLAKHLIIAVFAIAGLFLIGYSFVDFHEAFNRSLALIVLACPCALAFGTPLTLGLALKKAQEFGILIRDGSVFERIQKVNHIFFDKTGTLTYGRLQLTHVEPSVISVKTQEKILALESISYHPIAFAIREKWNHLEQTPNILHHQEVLGQGVRGTINGKVCEVRDIAESLHESEIGVGFFEDGELICRLYFSDSLREESASLIQSLQRQGIQTSLLTGDKRGRALEVGQACGLKKEQIYSELFPEDKKEIIERHKNTCMIGDGANDSLSLQAADIGIALKGSVEMSLNSADVHFTKGGLTPFVKLLELSNTANYVLRRNLAISLIYNSIGGTLALLGLINPLLAAILMPISSAIIVISTIWGFRK